MNPAADQYVLGKGRFHFARRLPNGTLDGFRFIGNVPSFTLTPSSDNVAHTSSLNGLNQTDRTVYGEVAYALAFTTDNMSAENKALWMNATIDAVAVSAQTGAKALPLVRGGRQYDVGFKDVNVTGVTSNGTPLIRDTDWAAKSATGLVGFGDDFPNVVITYNVAASTRDVVNASDGAITGAIKFFSDNPDTGSGKLDYEFFLPSVRVAADGDWGLIGDDWQTLGFAGAVMLAYDSFGNRAPPFIISEITPDVQITALQMDDLDYIVNVQMPWLA